MIPEGVACVKAGFLSVLLSSVFVGSLVVWRSKLNRDNPIQIKRRFVSASCMMIVAPFISYLYTKFEEDERILTHLGIRRECLLLAATLPLLLTGMLYLGPLTMVALSESTKTNTEPFYRRLLTCLKDPVWVRNYVMSPLCEEWVFRACMIPIISSCELMSAASIILGAAVLFGAGHFIPCLLVHIFCNFVGLPDFDAISKFPKSRRIIIITNFILGVSLWLYFVNPLTNPALYENILHWDRFL